jgi:hypothetical protein
MATYPDFSRRVDSLDDLVSGLNKRHSTLSCADDLTECYITSVQRSLDEHGEVEEPVYFTAHQEALAYLKSEFSAYSSNLPSHEDTQHKLLEAGTLGYASIGGISYAVKRHQVAQLLEELFV